MFTKLLKGTEVADILNISLALAYRLMSTGEIPTIKIGRTVRVRQEDLSSFLEQKLCNKTKNFPDI